jgi:hypothetical protein
LVTTIPPIVLEIVFVSSVLKNAARPKLPTWRPA